MGDRSSERVGTGLAPLVPDSERARRDVENGFRQFDALLQKIREGNAGGFFRLRVSDVLELNRLAVDGLTDDAGRFRLGPVRIKNSKHVPPDHTEVPRYVEDLCDYVNDNWARSAIHLAAYVMWRLNWIHPFSDGNGRATRAAAYLILCVRMKTEFPGDRTVPTQISDDKVPYYNALEAADEAYARDKTIDLAEMEALLRDLLRKQIDSAASATWDRATERVGRPDTNREAALARTSGGEAGATRNYYMVAAIGAIATLVAALIGKCGG